MDKWLMNNNAAKIIALVLGVLLFAVVHHNEDTFNEINKPLVETRVIDGVKVHVKGVSNGMVVKGMSPDSVSVKVSGKTAAITAALAEEYKVVVDLADYGAGKHVVPLQYHFPDGVRVESIQPSMVSVTLEEVQTKQMDVVIKTRGTPAEGYTVGTPIITPSNRVHVSLPTSRMTEVKSVTGMVNVSGANESVIRRQVKLTAYDTAGNEIKDAVITPSVVEVEVPITKPFKTVPLQISYKGQLPAGLSVAQITPNVNQVTLYGPQSALDKIEFYDQAVVDLSSFTSGGQYTMNVNLTLPPNLEKMEPSQIQVSIVISEEKTRTISSVPITLTGNSDRLVTSITDPASQRFDVTVVGAPAIVDALKVEDIQLIANVNDLPPGNHLVTLKVNLPHFVRLAKSERFTAKITIKEKEAPVVTNPEPAPDPSPETETDAGQDSGSDSNSSNPESGATTDPKEENEGQTLDPNHGASSGEPPATDETSQEQTTP